MSKSNALNVIRATVRSGLSSDARALLVVLALEANGTEGVCRLSNGELAEQAGLSSSGCDRALRELRGLLEATGPTRRRAIRILPEPLGIRVTGGASATSPVVRVGGRLAPDSHQTRTTRDDPPTYRSEDQKIRRPSAEQKQAEPTEEITELLALVKDHHEAEGRIVSGATVLRNRRAIEQALEAGYTPAVLRARWEDCSESDWFLEEEDRLHWPVMLNGDKNRVRLDRLRDELEEEDEAPPPPPPVPEAPKRRRTPEEVRWVLDESKRMEAEAKRLNDEHRARVKIEREQLRKAAK